MYSQAIIKGPMTTFKNRDKSDTSGVIIKVRIQSCALRFVEVHRSLTLVQKLRYDRCSSEAYRRAAKALWKSTSCLYACENVQ